MKRTSIVLVSLGVALALVSISPSSAQYSDDRYDYCRERAEDISGYDGRTPRSHRRGGVVGDAVRGSIRGRVLSGIFGGNREERERAARRGARGAVIGGAIRRGVERGRERRARRDYRRELDRCMEGR